MTVMTMMADGVDTMRSPEMIRIASCFTMFGDFEKAFDTFLEDVRLNELTETHGLKVKDKHTIVEPWPLRITEKSTTEEFEIRCASSRTGCERYMEFERI